MQHFKSMKKLHNPYTDQPLNEVELLRLYRSLPPSAQRSVTATDILRELQQLTEPSEEEKRQAATEEQIALLSDHIEELMSIIVNNLSLHGRHIPVFLLSLLRTLSEELMQLIQLSDDLDFIRGILINFFVMVCYSSQSFGPYNMVISSHLVYRLFDSLRRDWDVIFPHPNRNFTTLARDPVMIVPNMLRFLAFFRD